MNRFPNLVLAILVVAGASASCGDDSDSDSQAQATSAPIETTTTGVETTTTAVETTTTTVVTTTTEAELTDIEIAQESMAVWNTGDADTYLAFFTEDAILGEWPVHAPHVRDGMEFYMALGNQVVMDDCEQWEDGRIRCDVVEHDQLSGPVGARTESTWSFWIVDGRIDKATAIFYERSPYWFIRQMAFWLESAYPDVWESMFAIPGQCSDHDEYNCWENWYATADTAAVLLELAPEFIAQSDEWSISE